MSRTQYTIKLLRNKIEEMDGTLLSDFATITSKTIVKIRCNKHNHIWYPTAERILRLNRWCRKCSDDDKRYSYNYVKSVIEEKDGTLLSASYENVNKPIGVRCNKCNHEWDTLFIRVLNGSWCAKCAGNKRYTYEEATHIIQNNGGILLTNKIDYVNATTKLNVRCITCNHTWYPVLHSILTNHWCPNCKTKNQTKLTEIVKDLFKTKVLSNYTDFKWLQNRDKCGTQRLDIYVPSIKLVIEYDGEQHFRPVKFSQSVSHKKANDIFNDQKRRDRKKNRRIKSHPEDVSVFIRIPYTEPITKENVIRILKENGVQISSLSERH